MISDKHRRLARERRARHARVESGEVDASPSQSPAQRTGFDRIYHDKYKLLFFITIGLVLASIVVIGLTFVRTGDVIYKGVSLSGGVTITLQTQQEPYVLEDITQLLRERVPGADIAVREINDLGTQVAIVIEAAPPSAADDLSAFETKLFEALEEDVPQARSLAAVEIVGPSLGESFFKQIARAVLVAFVFMALVVFMYFGETKTQKALVALLSLVEGFFIWYAHSLFMTVLAVALAVVLVWAYVRWSIPSAAVILAAISTLLFTIAVVDLLGMRISTAGIAAFLMLIGYSVDTDILLSTRVLKRSEGSVYERIKSTIKTGLTMEMTTLCATLVAIIFTQSDVIREIMTILFIGLIADIPFTWIQNAGILRLHLEKKRGAS